MIASKYRIRKHFFPTVMRGVHFSGEYFKIIASNPVSKHQNFAVVISKKYAKYATDRNYTKRVIYHFFQEHLDKFPEKAFVCLMIKKIPEIEAFFKEITTDLENITKNIQKKYGKAL